MLTGRKRYRATERISAAAEEGDDAWGGSPRGGGPPNFKPSPGASPSASPGASPRLRLEGRKTLFGRIPVPKVTDRTDRAATDSARPSVFRRGASGHRVSAGGRSTNPKVRAVHRPQPPRYLCLLRRFLTNAQSRVSGHRISSFYSRSPSLRPELKRTVSTADNKRLAAGDLGAVLQIADSQQAAGKDMVMASVPLPREQWPAALQQLERVPIFSQALPAERERLAERVRLLSVAKDETVIREGQRSPNPAIFMILSGVVTISVMMELPGGAMIDAVVTQLRTPSYFGEGMLRTPFYFGEGMLRIPSYFGEGMVLTGSPAYASVRATEDMQLYLVPKTDLDAAITSATRGRMVRDYHVRQFRKQHMNDLWDVIRAEGDEQGRDLVRAFCRGRGKHIMDFYDEQSLHEPSRLVLSVMWKRTMGRESLHMLTDTLPSDEAQLFSGTMRSAHSGRNQASFGISANFKKIPHFKCCSDDTL
ncbi:hypothetical protein JKP88DRAFT_262806 [Tribonema minus]|uniref:Cyclic nucleotide-binding domain-containing protein n=1 Tax=Tribonema minus TaxID=303371 RepID=A0A836CIA0_9STRA|nr:hypothetical protein JKP88DRAFT_262806 [Tribonema minus]